jgi:hypothetical protein
MAAAPQHFPAGFGGKRVRRGGHVFIRVACL